MYEILPVTTQEIKWPYETLPKPPFRLLIIKPSGAGGSTLVANMLSPRFPYKKFFGKNIFIFSPTFESDPVYKDVKIEKENVCDHYDESILREIYDEQKKEKAKKRGLEPVLIILDDLIIALPSSQKNYVSHLFMSGRHMNISIIILSQSYKLISRGIRMNATHIITMSVSSAEALKMGEECCADNFIEKLNKCCCRPYGWMIEDLTKHPYAKERFRDQFSNTCV